MSELERVRLAAEGRPDVIVRDEYLSSEHHNALLGHSDAYVSLHRSKGFGMDMAKAMSIGKPVVATGYSGTSSSWTTPRPASSTTTLVPSDRKRPYPPDSVGPARASITPRLMRRVVYRRRKRRSGPRAGAHRADFSLVSRGALGGMLEAPGPRGHPRLVAIRRNQVHA